MSWLVALVGLTVAAPPEIEQAVVLVGRRTAVAAPVARTLALDTSKHLGAAGVPLALEPDAVLKQLARVSVKDSASCNGKRACLAELGRQLKVPWVVTLSVASMDAEVSLGLELLRVADEAVVETDSLLLPKKGRVDPQLLAGFAAKVKARLVPAAVAPPPPVESPPVALVTDTPKEQPLSPARVPEVSVPPPPAPAPRSRAPAIILGSVGVAALAAGAVLLGVGLTGRAPLAQGDVGPDGRVRSPLTVDEAQALNASTQGLAIGGAAALAVGLGLGTAGVLAW